MDKLARALLEAIRDERDRLQMTHGSPELIQSLGNIARDAQNMAVEE